MVALKRAVGFIAGEGGRELFDVVLLVTVHLADVFENMNEDILTAMCVTVARLVEVTLKL